MDWDEKPFVRLSVRQTKGLGVGVGYKGVKA